MYHGLIISVKNRSHLLPPSSPHAPALHVQRGGPLRGGAEDGAIVPVVLVVEVGRVEEVKALQGALHRQAEAGGPAPVARQPALGWGGVSKMGKKNTLNALMDMMMIMRIF